jgi:predicted small lipoprotein YifL
MRRQAKNRRTSKTGIVALLMASALAGCGIRGPLEAPPQAGTQPAPPADRAQAESGQGKPANAAPKPHQGFILDGLLR